jgi:hypothetical protein
LRGQERTGSLRARTCGSSGGAVMSNLEIAMRWLQEMPESTQVPLVGRFATEYTVTALPSAVKDVEV